MHRDIKPGNILVKDDNFKQNILCQIGLRQVKTTPQV